MPSYCTVQFNGMTLLEFACQFTMPKTLGPECTQRSKRVVVTLCPYFPSDPKYEQYCRQTLTQHKPFCQLRDLLVGSETYPAMYAVFLQSGSVPPSLLDDVHHLEEQIQQHTEEENTQVCKYTVVYRHCNGIYPNP